MREATRHRQGHNTHAMMSWQCFLILNKDPVWPVQMERTHGDWTGDSLRAFQSTRCARAWASCAGARMMRKMGEIAGDDDIDDSPSMCEHVRRSTKYKLGGLSSRTAVGRLGVVYVVECMAASAYLLTSPTLGLTAAVNRI